MFDFLLRFSGSHRNLLKQHSECQEELTNVRTALSTVQQNLSAERDARDNLIRSTANYFPASMVHTHDQWTLDHWNYLHRGYDNEATIRECIERIRAFTMVTHDGLVATYNIASHLVANNIAGSFVETGVCKGGSAAMMALAVLANGATRHLHLFDSFQGIPHPKESEYESWMLASWGVSKEMADGELNGFGSMAVEKSIAEKVLFNIVGYPREAVTFHVGWFQDTVPIARPSIERIALLRLDGDLYDSTLVCLEHLYPLVVKGGFVIIDDYRIRGCKEACHDFFRRENITPYLHYIDGARYFVKE